MGMAYEHDIRRACNYLLSILAAEGKVPYARFYDGTDETGNKLLTGMGIRTLKSRNTCRTLRRLTWTTRFISSSGVGW